MNKMRKGRRRIKRMALLFAMLLCMNSVVSHAQGIVSIAEEVPAAVESETTTEIKETEVSQTAEETETETTLKETETDSEQVTETETKSTETQSEETESESKKDETKKRTARALTDTTLADLQSTLSAAIDGDVITITDAGTLSATIQIDKSVTLDFKGNTITAAANQTAFRITGAAVVVKNLVLNGSGTVSGNGGAIAYDHAGGNLTIENSTIRGFRASVGGGLCGNTSQLTLTNTIFEKNMATVKGGGIYTSGNITLGNGSRIRNNYTTADGHYNGNGGGGIYTSGTSTITFLGDASVHNNGINQDTTGLTTPNGGGIYGGGDLVINDGSIAQNGAKNHGGGIYAGGSLTLNNTEITGCYTTLGTKLTEYGGGAVFMYGGDSAVFKMTGNAVLHNNGHDLNGALTTPYGSGFMSLKKVRVDGYDNNAGKGITNNAAIYGGGVFIDDYGVIEGLEITKNYASVYGGGVFGNGKQDINCTLYMKDCYVAENVVETSDSSPSNRLGGGIYSNQTLTIESSTITKNIAGNGGGIFGSYLNGKTTLTVLSSEVSYNEATGLGGGMEANMQKLIVDNSTIINNTSASETSGGGGIFVSGGPNVTTPKLMAEISNTVVSGNTVKNRTTGEWTGYGGGICSIHVPITVTNCEVKDNSAKYGGGMNAPTNLDAYINDSTFKNNTAQLGGGITTFGTLHISGGYFEENSATSNGGAVWPQTARTVEIAGASFTKNTAGNVAGALFANKDTNCTIKDSNFTENEAVNYGGAVYIREGANCAIEKSAFSKNHVEEMYGGAIYASENTTVTMKDSEMADNWVEVFHGGGMYIQAGADVTVEGSTIHGNKAVANNAANETDYDNMGQGGGFYVEDYTNLKLDADTVFYDNEAAFYALWALTDDPSSDLYTDSQTHKTNVFSTEYSEFTYERATDTFKIAYNNYDVNYRAVIDEDLLPVNYEASGKLTLTAKKMWEEDVNRSLQDGEFAFEVLEDDKVVATGVNQTDGTIIFSDIEYVLNIDESDVGKHIYKIREVAGTDKTIIYDQTEYVIEVNVTDDENGNLLTEIVSATKQSDLVFVNDITKVAIKKVDEAGKPLAGAELALYDAAGNLVESWTSTAQAHSMDAVLNAGATYTVKELEAPAGYMLAEAIVFTVNTNGEVNDVVMVDKVKDEQYRVKVTKHVKQDGENHSMNYSFYATLFWDKECTQKASDVQELKLENSYTTTAVFENLAQGTYYIAETDADGKVLDMKDPSVFFTNEISNEVLTLNAENAEQSTVIINHLIDSPETKDDGVIQINKTVVKGKEKLKVTDTFYFTLFSDKEMTNAIATKELSLKSASAGKVAFDHLVYGVYYIAETDKDGKALADSFAYDVSISKEQVTVKDKKAIEVKIVNDAGKDTTDDTDKKDNKKATVNGKTISKTLKSIKTGDTTQMVLYLVILAAAVTAIVVVIRTRRAKKI